MTRILSLVTFAALSHAAAIRSAGPPAVFSDLKNIDQITNTFRQAVVNFNNGPIGLQPPNYAQELENGLTQCATDGHDTTSLTPAELQTICTYVTGPLYNDTATLLNAFVSKKAVFTSSGLKSVVISDLQTFQSDTSTCLANIPSGGPTPAISPNPCSSAGAEYNKIYASAIAAYQK